MSPDATHLSGSEETTYSGGSADWAYPLPCALHMDLMTRDRRAAFVSTDPFNNHGFQVFDRKRLGHQIVHTRRETLN